MRTIKTDMTHDEARAGMIGALDAGGRVIVRHAGRSASNMSGYLTAETVIFNEYDGRWDVRDVTVAAGVLLEYRLVEREGGFRFIVNGVGLDRREFAVMRLRQALGFNEYDRASGVDAR